MDEVLLIDKPKDWTSFDVVAKVRGELRRITGNKKVKVGHAGTLDPMATGLLIVLTGNMTKQQDDFMKKDKVYEAEITLGAVSDTDDAEGKIVESKVEGISSKVEIEDALKSFVGDIEQMPPQYSAIKINGQKAYDIARKGQTADLKLRKVTIYSIENVEVDGLKVRFRCHVSSGTYIRSLARDLGEKLCCGGYLSALRRTKIGDYSVSKAHAISDINLDFFQKTVATTE
ncbi:MAG: tRNA pseudouridine(55) synthase TruB [Candidatus Saccharibacteria bacterium]|nr:tRNA pseudouridine(55) synthase TruB [Candidatus Saccharibacteria bacterium]